MADRPREPTPPESRPPAGTPASPFTDPVESPELRSAKVVRAGAVVMAALWEE